MSRKNKSLAGFDAVASDNNNTNINVNDNDNVIENILGNQKAKSVLVGIYFEPEVAEALDQAAKKGGRGAKSKIVNEAVRRILGIG